MEFNINDYVKVKLTNYGLSILEAQHNELHSYFSNQQPFEPPKTDENGYTKFQLWHLMQTFGPHIGASLINPFETDIIICE